MSSRNWMLLAQQVVPIGEVLSDLFGIEVPYGEGAWKVECPLGYEHRDGGARRDMKVFTETNTAYCFNHREQFDNVTLWRILHGDKVSWNQSSIDLLKHFEVMQRFTDPDERWDRLDSEKDTEVDQVNVKDSLRLFATSLPNYSVHQYRDEVLDTMRDLYLKANELPNNASYDTMDAWLTESKNTLTRLWRENEFD